MAEPAQPQPMSIPTTDIKQEHDLMGLEGIDFSLPPELSSKRPLEEEPVPSTENPDAKRLKAETHQAEDSLEDGLALLVQNALSNVGDLVDQFGPPPDEPPNTEDVMDLDAVSALDLPQPAPTFYEEPLKYIRHAQSQTLINLTFSLLYAFVQHQPVEELMKLMKDGQSEHCKSYRQLRRVFSSSLATFSDNSLLTVADLEGLDDCQAAIDLINLAQFLSWLLDDTTESYSEANTHFFTIFPMQFSELPHGASDALLAIRTQFAIKKLVSKAEGVSIAQVLQENLVDGLEEKLRAQHGGTAMTEQETPFVETAKARKASLETDTREQINIVSLREKHQPQMPLQSLSNYVKSRLVAHADLASKFGISIELPPEPIDIESFADSMGDAELDLDDLSSFFEKTASGLVQDALAGLTEQENGEGSNNQADDKANGVAKANGKPDFMTDYKELEALVAESTSNYVKTTLHGLSPVPYQPTVPASTAESMTAQLPYLAQLQQHQAQHPYYTFSQPPIVEQPPPQPVAGENLPPNQTFPSAILYDKARQAALSKSSAHTRREGLHSTRRPWTQEEEKALMAGLDMVKGPHWSQILTLFGQNGTISDILKDRTQVQLKDKARNLKLFFLKTNSEMPYYLQAVTGELKTRAPTQAARKEAEERARLNSEEDQAKLQGIMALAGGLQHPQHRTGAPGAGGVTSGVLTPAQAASAAQARPGNAAVAPRTVAPAPGQHGVQAAGRPQTGLPPHVPRPQAQQGQPGQPGQQQVQIEMQQGYGQQPQQHQQIRPAQPQQAQPGQPGARPAVQQNGAMPAPQQRPGVAAPGAMPQGQVGQVQAQRPQNVTASPGAVGMKLPQQVVQQQQQQPQVQQAQPQQSQQQQQQPQQQQQLQPQQQQQPQQAQAAPSQPKPAEPKPAEVMPMSQEAAQEAMNAAEAALLEELKAVS